MLSLLNYFLLPDCSFVLHPGPLNDDQLIWCTHLTGTCCCMR